MHSGRVTLDGRRPSVVYVLTALNGRSCVIVTSPDISPAVQQPQQQQPHQYCKASFALMIISCDTWRPRHAHSFSSCDQQTITSQYHTPFVYSSSWCDKLRGCDKTKQLCSTSWCDYCGGAWSWQACFKCVCKTYFFWLRQLRRVHRSLDPESVKTLVHAFVTSHVDYCNSVLSWTAPTASPSLATLSRLCCSVFTTETK